ncbi:MAG: hypothetical protein AABX99_02870 [Nanoarchaeota archaeon]
MEIPLITALVIQSNNIKIDTFSKDGKWGYELYRFERGNYRPEITCNPIYENRKIAMEKGKELLEAIRQIDLSEKKKNLTKIIGEEESKMIAAIVPVIK